MLAQGLQRRRAAQDRRHHGIGEGFGRTLEERPHGGAVGAVLERGLDAPPLVDGNDDEGGLAALGDDLPAHW